jgi:hypothetical protein
MMAWPTVTEVDVRGRAMPEPTKPPRRPGATSCTRRRPDSVRRICAARGMRVSGVRG